MHTYSSFIYAPVGYDSRGCLFFNELNAKGGAVVEEFKVGDRIVPEENDLRFARETDPEEAVQYVKESGDTVEAEDARGVTWVHMMDHNGNISSFAKKK